jgi:FkbH-like protein
MIKIDSKIKLVIWDLDETFWEGTISEENIGIINYNIKLLEDLTNRGIVNSICSKNNYEQVKNKLIEIGIWDFFVFPQISWDPKGKIIDDMISSMGLRAQNVLFIDDNVMNLNEALFFNSDLNVCTPDFISNLATNAYLNGKEDLSHNRLKQYKNLEKKQIEFKKSKLSNVDFLRESEIKVNIFKNCLDELDRIHELVERTNQLNYTKNRVSKAELRDQIKDQANETGYVRVNDKYGDYGISGFYLKNNKNELIHFLFSCRTMNMYVESWLYKELNSPIIKNKTNVALELNVNQDFSFINAVSKSNQEEYIRNLKDNYKVLLIGGCDLDQVAFYLNSKNLRTEFNFVNNLNLDVRTDHTFLFRQYEELTEEFKREIEDLIVLPEKLELKIFEENWDVLVYSCLTDYSRGLYKNKKNGFILPFDSLNIDWTDNNNWRLLPKHLESLPLDFLKKLSNEYEFLGGITPILFKENIEWLINKFPNRYIVFINGSEINLENVNFWEKNMHLRHKDLNKVIDELDSKNVKFIDVRKFVENKDDVTDNIRHYVKQKYKVMSDNIVLTINTFGLNIKKETDLNIYLKKIKKKINKVSNKINKL